jgi:hypothetical protein
VVTEGGVASAGGDQAPCQAVERLRELDRLPAEAQEHPTVVGVDLGEGQAADGGELLGVEQDEEAGEPVAGIEGIVIDASCQAGAPELLASPISRPECRLRGSLDHFFLPLARIGVCASALPAADRSAPVAFGSPRTLAASDAATAPVIRRFLVMPSPHFIALICDAECDVSQVPA